MMLWFIGSGIWKLKDIDLINLMYISTDLCLNSIVCSFYVIDDLMVDDYIIAITCNIQMIILLFVLVLLIYIIIVVLNYC